MTDLRKRENIRRLTNEFDLTSDLFKLAQAQILIEKLLKENEFPTEKYKRWLQTESPEFFSTT